MARTMALAPPDAINAVRAVLSRAKTATSGPIRGTIHHTVGDIGTASPNHHTGLPTRRLADATATKARPTPIQPVASTLCHGARNVDSGAGSRGNTVPRTLPSGPMSGRVPFRKLSIFFPMWNEEEYIQRAIDAGREVCAALMDSNEILDFELIIVNDASTDATGALADALAASDHRVVVVHHPVNRKLGGSMKSGFEAATGDLILYTDADLPFDMNDVRKAVRLMRVYEADIVSAYRFDRTGEGYVRSVYSTLYNLLVRAMFGVRVRDVNFAFKLCRASIFEHVTLKSEGSFIDAELVIRAQRAGLRIVQFGVDYFARTRGVSTLSSPAVIVKILSELRELRTELQAIEPVASHGTP